MNPVLNLYSIKESLWYFVAFANGGRLVGNWKIWRKQFLKNKSPAIFLHLKYVFCFYINPLTESKIAVVCYNVPLIPEFSPNSGMLSFEARMLMLSFYSYTVCISFKAKWILPQWQVKQSNLWKRISWKRKRLEIINKIEAKRASSATRELNVNTLRWSV